MEIWRYGDGDGLCCVVLCCCVHLLKPRCAGTIALGVIWMLMAIALLVVGARLWTQWKITRKLGLSDALMALSIVNAIPRPLMDSCS